MNNDAAVKNRSIFSPLGGYFSANQWLAYAVIILFGIAFRWYALDMRPVHHDESQHGMFGRYFYDAPDVHFYRYNPMLHGPMLYNLYRAVYSSIGSDIWSFRVPMAFLGTLYLFLPLLFRRWFSPRALLFLTAGIALGPSLIFWSRFAREDFYVLFGMLSMLLGAVGLFPRLSGSLVIFGFMIQLCTKANVFVHIPIILAFVFFELFFGFALKLYRENKYSDIGFHGGVTIGSFAIALFLLIGGNLGNGPLDIRVIKYLLLAAVIGVFVWQAWIANRALGRGTVADAMVNNLRSYWKETLIGFFISAIIYIYLYSAGGRYPEGIVAGLGFDAIAYWINQHSIERISGPFLFQFYTLTWYELPFIVFFFLHVFDFYTRDRIRQGIGLAIFLVSVLLVAIFWSPDSGLAQNPVAKFLGVKDLRDIFGAPLLLVHPLVVTVTHLIENRRTLAIWGYLFTSFFFSYSYLKEKVPWLSMYSLILGIIYLTLYFDDRLRERPILNWRRIPWSTAIFTVGAILIILGMVFIGEGYLLVNPEIMNESRIVENSGFLAFGLCFLMIGYGETKVRAFGTFNLAKAVLILVALFNLRIAFITNFVRPGHASEYISQVHTTPEFHRMALQLREKLTASVSGRKPLVLGRGESTWPITWYMAGVDGFHFDVPADKKLEDFDYIFESWDDEKGLKKIPAGYSGRQLEFRGWWVPDFNTISIRRFLRYAINHTPWSSTGFTYLLYMTKDQTVK